METFITIVSIIAIVAALSIMLVTIIDLSVNAIITSIDKIVENHSED